MDKLDLRDKKLLFELDKNSRINLTVLAKKLKTSKEVVHYRLNKLINNQTILKFHTVPATYRFGLKAFKVYLRLHNVSKENLEEMIAYLLKNKDVFWVGVAKGRWDMMFGVWAKNIEEFFKAHDMLMDKFSKHIQEKELSISRENIQYNRRWIYSDDSKIEEFNFGETEAQIKLDLKDKKILDEMVKDSRVKIVDLVGKTKLSVDSISHRIKKMEKQKIIRGYKCLLNPSKLGFVTCKAFVYFKNIDEQRKKYFIEYCKKIENTINIVITFAPWDLEIMFETKNYESYFDIMDDIKEKFKDIIKIYESALISSEPKQRFLN